MDHAQLALRLPATGMYDRIDVGNMAPACDPCPAGPLLPRSLGPRPPAEYVGASIGYRLTNEAQWLAQIHDCKVAIRWMKAHAKEYNLDATKIGVWGTSAGGHLVSFLGTSGDVKELEGTLGKQLDQNSSVTCVMNFYGPGNFLSMVRQPSTMDRTKGGDYPEALLLGGPVQGKEDAAKEASPVTNVSKGDAPFFTAHGTKDPHVPFAQAQEIHASGRRCQI